ncbi:MAG: HAD family hydrolase [Candidatus Omnitrophota bacterium]
MDQTVRQPLIVFLDRDGVISQFYADDYTKSWDEFKFLPGAKEALRILHQAGAVVFIVSNQSGVGKGLYTNQTLQDINHKMVDAIADAGGKVWASYYCPHTEEDGCFCRKPRTGLIKRASAEFKLDIKNSYAYLVGDSETDIIAGQQAGLLTILVLSGKTIMAKETESWSIRPDHIAPDLMGALKYIL